MIFTPQRFTILTYYCTDLKGKNRVVMLLCAEFHPQAYNAGTYHGVRARRQRRMAAFKTQKEKMDDQRSYLVVKDNALIQKAKYNLTANEQKLVNYVITMIKPGEEEFKKYEIRALDFARLCGIDPKNVYRDFRNMIDSIDEKAFWVNLDNRVIKLRWFNEPEYNERKGTISLILDSRIKTYLLGIQNNFTEYELYNILAMTSKYSPRLYELAKSYAYKGWVDISVDALRENLMADVYTAFGNFKQRVLAPAIKEINEYTDITVSYDCITDKGELVKGRLQGKRITYIRLYIENKDTLDRFATYNKTVGKIEKRNQQFRGQLSLNFDSTGTLVDIA